MFQLILILTAKIPNGGIFHENCRKIFGFILFDIVRVAKFGFAVQLVVAQLL